MKAKKYTKVIVLCVLLHSCYALIVHFDTQKGSGLLQLSEVIVDPVSVWFGIEYDLDGQQFFQYQLMIGGIQWAIIGALIAGFQIRRLAQMNLNKNSGATRKQ